jgi:putative membrane protein
MLQDHGHHRIGVLLMFLALIAIAALVAYLVVRITSRRVLPLPAVGPAASPIQDAALQQLRLRYARGEVSRTDFLQAATDLGAALPPEASPPAATGPLDPVQ